MALILLFTFVLLPFLLVALSHLWFAPYHQRERHNNHIKTNINSSSSKVVEPLTLKQKSFPSLSIGEDDRLIRLRRIRTSMDEKYEHKPIRRKASLQHIDEEEAQKQDHAQAIIGQPTSPTPSPLKKSSSSRTNCLCSPTTHIGSFRCRLHRHGSNFRRGHSVGSDLSELANKFSSKSSMNGSSLQMH